MRSSGLFGRISDRPGRSAASTRTRGLSALVAGALAWAPLPASAEQLYVTKIKRVSNSSAGAQANGPSGGGEFSPDGKKVVFWSSATNLVLGDTNGVSDIFVKDLQNGSVKRLTVKSNGVQADGASYDPHFSPDGEHVVFVSRASNLVANDRNYVEDIFRVSLRTRAITRVSVNSFGGELVRPSDQPVFSPSGQRLAFRNYSLWTDTVQTFDIMLKTFATGNLQNVSKTETEADIAGAYNPLFPPTFGTVGFVAPGLPYDEYMHVKNLNSGVISYISLGSQASSSIDLSSWYEDIAYSTDGKYIYYHYAWDFCPVDPELRSFCEEYRQVIVKDLEDDGAEDLTIDGRLAPVMSPDSKWLLTTQAFYEPPFDARRAIYVRSMETGLERRLFAGNGRNYDPRFSKGGRKIVFTSTSSNFIAKDTNSSADVFVADVEER